MTEGASGTAAAKAETAARGKRPPLPLRAVFHVLRFFNLLEPGLYVLSISKVFMWSMLGLTFYVVIYRPGDVAAILGAAGALAGTMGNYAWRRYVHWKAGVILPAAGAPERD